MSTEPLSACEREVAFDIMRTVAAIAVVVIHVIGPYRKWLGMIPDAEWVSAIAINGALRWCVPIFIMITGALLLADPRPFNAAYFVRRRIAKVLIPFIAWSLIYAIVAGFTLHGFELTTVVSVLLGAPTHATYYHLGFFYYFIPLYLLVPLLRVFVQCAPRVATKLLLAAWLCLTVAYLAGQSGPWSVNLVMFGGYLLLGWMLWQIGAPPLALLAMVAAVAVVVGDVVVIRDSLEAGRIDVGRWFSYKTFNTVIVATFIFVLALYASPRLSPCSQSVFTFIGRHSLGVYLLHPLFLWPLRTLDLYVSHPLVVIPLWTLFAFSLALAASFGLSRLRATAWLVP